LHSANANIMISTKAGAPGKADADGSGDAFDAKQLTQAGWQPNGTVTVDGATFGLPKFGTGANDNLLAADKMTGGRDVLTDLHDWFDDRNAGLADLGLQAEFAESPPDRVKRSVSVTIASSSRVGQLVVWDTGEAELTLGDIGSDEVVEEHREITSHIGLQDATQTLLAWLEAGSNWRASGRSAGNCPNAYEEAEVLLEGRIEGLLVTEP
jgi:hypothetical protein